MIPTSIQFRSRGIPLGGATTVEELKDLVVTHKPSSLEKVLKAFEIFLPVISGDLDVIERIAYETCEDQAQQGVIYFEARYAPHPLCGAGISDGQNTISPREVVEAVAKGLARGKADFGVDSRQILCCVCGLERFDHEITELVESCRELGVVAVDAAGSAHGAHEQYAESVFKVFKAIHELYAERIGHGYHILRDEEAYRSNFVEGPRIHLEACPYSSVMTGSVPLDWPRHPISRLDWPRHPISRWAEDDVSFSISRDDPTCFDNTSFSELTLAHKQIGLSIHQLWKCQLNAAEASFLDEQSKKELVEKIRAAEPAV